MKYEQVTPELTALFDAVEKLLDKKIVKAIKKKEPAPNQLKVSFDECAELEALAKAAGATMDKEYENYHIRNQYCMLVIRTLGRGAGSQKGQRGGVISGSRTYGQNFWVSPVGGKDLPLKEALVYLRDASKFDRGAAIMERLGEAVETRIQATARVNSWAKMMLPIGTQVRYDSLAGEGRIGTVVGYGAVLTEPGIVLGTDPDTAIFVEITAITAIVELPEDWELTAKYYGCGQYD